MDDNAEYTILIIDGDELDDILEIINTIPEDALEDYISPNPTIH